MASRKHKIGCCVANAYPKVGRGWGPHREIYRNSETIFVTSKIRFFLFSFFFLCITRLGFFARLGSAEGTAFIGLKLGLG